VVPLEEPQPNPPEAGTVAVVVDVVGLVSFQASLEPQASKLEARLMVGDLATDAAGAFWEGGAGLERLNAELLYEVGAVEVVDVGCGAG